MSWAEEFIMENGFRLIILCFILGALSVGVLIVVPVHIYFPEESGSHTGYITESGVRGWLWKTHYIKFVDSQLSFGEGTTSYYFYGFDEKNLTLFNDAKVMQSNKTMVTVDYECRMFQWYWETSEACVVTGLR